MATTIAQLTLTSTDLLSDTLALSTVRAGYFIYSG